MERPLITVCLLTHERYMVYLNNSFFAGILIILQKNITQQGVWSVETTTDVAFIVKPSVVDGKQN